MKDTFEGSINITSPRLKQTMTTNKEAINKLNPQWISHFRNKYSSLQLTKLILLETSNKVLQKAQAPVFEDLGYK